MRPLPETVKNKVFELWMSGHDYRDISSQTNISLGSITNIINETRRLSPDIDELRSLNLMLKRNSISVNDAIEGTKFVSILKNLGVETSVLGDIIGRLVVYGTDAPKILSVANELLKLEKENGITYDKIVEEYKRISETVKRMQNEVSELKQEYVRMQNEIIDLQELRELRDKLRDLKIPVAKINQIIVQGKRLEELGFTPETAEFLSSELIKHGINIEIAIKTLVSLISEHKSIIEDIEIKRKELENTQNELEKNKKLLEEVKWSKEFNERILNDLERLIKEKSNVINELDEEIKIKRTHLEEELKKHKQELEEKHTKLISELEERIRSLQMSIINRQSELTKLDEKRRELGEEIKVLQETVELKTKELESRVREIEKKITLIEPLSKLARLMSSPLETSNRSNLESLIPIMINIRESWEKQQVKDPRKIDVINEFIKSLDRFLEVIVEESASG
jgi:chromosome segregation ATPase